MPGSEGEQLQPCAELHGQHRDRQDQHQEQDEPQESAVREFLREQTVLLTGVTGCLGSVLLEKLLRVFGEELRAVIVIVRPRANLSVQQRVDKLIATPGDVCAPNLGVEPAVRSELLCSTDLVFHCAANVSFGAGLRSAVGTNLAGTRELLRLCRDMHKLKSLVYVSTAYANSAEQRDITERLYPVTSDPIKVIDLVNSTSDQQLKAQTKKLLGRHPNAYTFTKQLAEHLLVKERGHIKLAIVRPSIVLGTWREPLPGWLEVTGGAGASGFLAGLMKGVFRTAPADPEKLVDLIPADLVVSALIGAAWSVATGNSRGSEVEIYHVTSGTRHPLTWGEYTGLAVSAARGVPCRALAWLPGVTCRPQHWRNELAFRVLQLGPSYLVDAVETHTSASHNRHKRESLVSVQQRFWRGMRLLRYFSQRHWFFDCTNLTDLTRRLSPVDRELLPTEVMDVNWRDLVTSCALTIRQGLFRDPPSSLPAARRNLARWRLVHAGAHCLLLILLYITLGWLLEGVTARLGLTLLCFLLFLWF